MAATNRHVSLGPIGEIVRSNLARLRRERGISAQQLVDRLAGSERPLGRSAISEIERSARRVDVDDLIALAVALSVSPLELLRPAGDDVALPGVGAVSGYAYEAWLEGQLGLDDRALTHAEALDGLELLDQKIDSARKEVAAAWRVVRQESERVKQPSEESEDVLAIYTGMALLRESVYFGLAEERNRLLARLPRAGFTAPPVHLVMRKPDGDD